MSLPREAVTTGVAGARPSSVSPGAERPRPEPLDRTDLVGSRAPEPASTPTAEPPAGEPAVVDGPTPAAMPSPPAEWVSGGRSRESASEPGAIGATVDPEVQSPAAGSRSSAMAGQPPAAGQSAGVGAQTSATGSSAGDGLARLPGNGTALAAAGSANGSGGMPPEYGPYLRRFRRRVEESLAYPLAARRRGLSGKVELEVMLDPSGRVAAVRVIESSSYSLLDDAAVAAVQGLSPEPLPENLPRRAIRIRLPLGFELQ